MHEREPAVLGQVTSTTSVELKVEGMHMPLEATGCDVIWAVHCLSDP